VEGSTSGNTTCSTSKKMERQLLKK